MNSKTNIQPSDGTRRYFLIDAVADSYRWVGRRADVDGTAIVRVRHAPVAATWQTVGIEWVTGTEHRPTCDFPIFYSIVRCFSQRALRALSACTDGGLEVLTLNGLDGAYVGVHCVRWVEGAANLIGIDQNKVSIHSTTFVPCINAIAVEGFDVFGLPEMVTKLVVSERFKSIVEKQGLTGLQFREVALC
jgi:hypothetical protein